MVSTAKKTHFFLIVAVLFCISVSVFAGGTREDPLTAARQLIEEKQYNDAIVILSEIMQTDPRRFDEAQKLVQEIHQARNQYNEKYSELIDIYKQDDLDLEQAYEIFAELEEMDKSPNRSTVEAFERAKATAVFVYNKKQFENIMADALALLKAGEYWQGAAAYLEGFDLYREQFEEQEYGNMVNNAVTGARERLAEAARAFESTEDDITAFFTRAADLLSRDDIDRFRTEFSDYAERVRAIAEQRKTAFSQALFLQEQGTELRNRYDEEVFHISYLYLLTMGRQETDETEGIIGAVDLFYSEYLDRVSGDLGTVVAEKLSLGKADFAGGRFEEAGEVLRQAKAYGEMLLENYRLWETRMYVDGDYNVSEEAYSIAFERLPDFVLQQTRGRIIDTYIEITDEVQVLEEIDRGVGGLSELEQAEEARRELLAAGEVLRGELDIWMEAEERTGTIESTIGGDYSPAAGEAESMKNILTAYLRGAVETERKTVVRMAEIRYAPLISRYEENAASSENGTRLLRGYEETIGEGEAVVTLKDPEGAKERFDSVLSNLDALSADFSGVVSFLREQDEYIREGEDVRDEIALGNEYIRRITELENRTADLAGEAQEQVLLAARYEEEGYYRINQARVELQRENFEEAREQLRFAGERFDMSLAVQIDPELREERDTLIANLNEEIITTQNNVIVAEVRELIETAKNYYTQEQYDRAERDLLRAQSRWAITHVDSKPEIDYWLQIVRVALYVQSGRKIEETDPLFAEMSQLLNLARENYLEGKRLAEGGRRDEAVDYFDKAEKNILYVKIPFPLNQEASVLSLRILQYKNPGEFDDLFRKKFNEALDEINTNPQQAYIDLQDLEAIRQNYPGIQNAIYQTEIKLGMRIPPPDPEKQRQSDQLYARALQIVQGGVRAQYPIALEYLNQALKLTPESQRVTTLLDRVEADLGGRTTTVLSNEAQQQYRLAEEKYIEGNYYEALRIVNNLLKNEQSSQYPPLLELKRRIESKI